MQRLGARSRPSSGQFDRGHWLDIKLDAFSIAIVWESHTEIGAKRRLRTEALRRPGIDTRTLL